MIEIIRATARVFESFDLNTILRVPTEHERISSYEDRRDLAMLRGEIDIDQLDERAERGKEVKEARDHLWRAKTITVFEKGKYHVACPQGA